MSKPTQWPCRGCGNLLSGRGGRIYCGPGCKPRCAVDGCGKPEHSKGWCSAHARRAARYGDPLAPLLRHPALPKEPSSRAWAEVDAPCVVCGVTVERGIGRRKHCSSACQAIDSLSKGDRPTRLDCNFCGKTFLLHRERTGRMQRADTKWCPDCGRDSPEVRRFKQYGVTKQQYDAAMAKGCELCGAHKPLHVDHDHSCCPVAPGKRARSCGKCIRGFVCGPCNRGLGLFFDNIDALERAVAYLKRGGAKT